MNVVALPDSRRFLSSTDEGAIWLWDIATGEVLKRYDPVGLAVYGLAVTRDGKRAVAGTWDTKRNTAKSNELPKLPPIAAWLFEIDTGRELRRLPTDASISHAQMSRDGRSAVIGTNTGVLVWDLDTGFTRPFTGVSSG